ncbi:DUF924 family protein [Lagierella sp.]|uniref:DUF924 family protein n=1 Tax=Lagierella sp. TaxID=2849657 RepID=UPI00262B8B29|nr:DUF924 family protein [Lagierella sp.]
MKDYNDVLDFWFAPENIDKQFDEDEDFDKLIEDKFLDTWEKAKEGLLVGWRDNPKGRLAEIIVLDQFSRNMFRHDIRTYTQDKMAIALAQELVLSDDYEELSEDEKKFALLPFMHSESLELHKWARPYFEELGEDTLHFEDAHLEVLKRFGRYPYQNYDLNRESTPEEIEALKINKDGFYRKKENK